YTASSWGHAKARRAARSAVCDLFLRCAAVSSSNFVISFGVTAPVAAGFLLSSCDCAGEIRKNKAAAEEMRRRIENLLRKFNPKKPVASLQELRRGERAQYASRARPRQSRPRPPIAC